MNSPRNSKKCPILFFAILVFFLAIPISYLFLKNISAKENIPTDVIVANISTTEAQIYWKGSPEIKYSVRYLNPLNAKEGLEQDSEIVGKDLEENKYIYTSKISNLEPETRYTINIYSKQSNWDTKYSFTTKTSNNSISLPKILTGKAEAKELVLITSGEDIYIKDTEKHGTWLIEDPQAPITQSTYAKYSYIEDIPNNRGKLNLLPSPTYAEEYSTGDRDINKLTLSQGINFIQIPQFINKQKERISSAKELVRYSNNNILSIGVFRNDNWIELIKNENNTTYGSDFELIPGEVYMISTKDNFTIQYVDERQLPDIDITILTGWNLLPASLFGITPITSTSILNREDLTTLKQVAVWNKEQSLFNYNLKNSTEDILGEGIPLLTGDAFFVKISY